MRLKLIGDGSKDNTKVFCSQTLIPVNAALVGVRQDYRSGNLIAMLEIEECDVKLYSPLRNPGPVQTFPIPTTFFTIEISNNTPSGFVFARISETGEKIDGVTEIGVSCSSANKWKVHIDVMNCDMLISQPSKVAGTGTSQGTSAPQALSPVQSVSYGGSGPGNPAFLAPTAPADPADPDQMQLDFDAAGGPVDCSHEWVNAGFSTIQYVCKHCNVPKP